MGRWGKGKLLTPSVGSKGYLSVELCGRTADGKYMSKRILVHILVANAFIAPDPERPVIDHINCDKRDNRVENLKRCTYEENNKNPITLERKAAGIARACSTNAFKENCSKAADSRKKQVRCWETGIIYESQAAAARHTGRSLATVQESCRRASSKHVFGVRAGRPILHFEYL